jgi:L,D-peptidoglycan transpeptidase YkuD (ErfK/YbiS/YcfS/YnhG family)
MKDNRAMPSRLPDFCSLTRLSVTGFCTLLLCCPGCLLCFASQGANVPPDLRVLAIRDAGDSLRAKQVKALCRCLNCLHIPAAHQQMVVVACDHWGSSTGTMWLVERTGRRWRPTDEHWAIDTGRNGMGWGRGLVENAEQLGAQKSEGDGKAPAGIYEFGTAFGYDPSAPDGSRMPYKQATCHDYFVDDAGSPDYNTWVRLDPGSHPREHWHSFEEMRRSDDRYSLGIVIKHNMNPTVPGAGSAIFLHVWDQYGHGTAGCTAMSKANMIHLLSWLDSERQPLLFQLPCDKDAVRRMRKARVLSKSRTEGFTILSI